MLMIIVIQRVDWVFVILDSSFVEFCFQVLEYNYVVCGFIDYQVIEYFLKKKKKKIEREIRKKKKIRKKIQWCFNKLIVMKLFLENCCKKK